MRSATVCVSEFVAGHGGRSGLEQSMGPAFTAREQLALDARRDALPGMVARLLAKRLVLELTAPEEAGEPTPEQLAAVEILADGAGRPVASAPGSAGADIHVSMSHDGDMASALVVVDELP